MTEKQLAEQIAQILYDRKAADIVALKVGHLTVLADYLIIATGRSALQVQALADYVEEGLGKQGILPRRVEGRGDLCWVVMDYAHVIVHIFRPDEREYYHLERLWSDGQNRVALPFEQEADRLEA
ncbi:MAG: ribosome silencing factor [Christensenellales bacterium]|jgi:ribosome-associated protein